MNPFNGVVYSSEQAYRHAMSYESSQDMFNWRDFQRAHGLNVTPFGEQPGCVLTGLTGQARINECARLGTDCVPEVLDFGREWSHDLEHMDSVAFNPGKFAGRMHARAALARDHYAPSVADTYARMRSGLSSLKSAPAAYSGNADKGNMRWGAYVPNVRMPDFSTLNLMGAFSDPYATTHSKYAEYDVTVPRRPEHHLQRDNNAKRLGYDAYDYS